MHRQLQTLPQIIEFLNQHPQQVLKRSDLASVLEQHREQWRTSIPTTGFISALLDTGRLRKIAFEFPRPYKSETRYVWGDVSLYEVCLSLRPNGYFSHYTAIRFHGLTEQLPKTIYLNVEQLNRSISSGTLTQASIDSALRRSPRATKQIAQIHDQRLLILQGKNTANFGVVTDRLSLDAENPDVLLRFTNLERTLIDAVVRPQYAGGVGEVLKAFDLARPRLSVPQLVRALQKLDYIYPYHQAIGFYLERAGYSQDQIALLQALPIRFDFQIAHGLKATRYVPQWRLRVPEGF